MAAAKKSANSPEDEGDKKSGAEGEEGEGVELPKKKISGKKLALIVVAAVVVLLGAAAALYFTGVIGGHAPAVDEEHKPAEDLGPVFYEMDQMLFNLQSSGRRPAFLKLKVVLQINSEEDRGAITAAMPRIKDSFQMYLRELTREELQGTAGLERLREELRLRVSATVAPVEVKDVLFTEMIFGE